MSGEAPDEGRGLLREGRPDVLKYEDVPDLVCPPNRS